MGLFINDDLHPNIYKNQCDIIEPNQGYFYKDHVSDMLNAQTAIHETLTETFDELKADYQKAERINADHWQQMTEKVRDIQERERKREAFEQEMLTRLSKLDQNNQQLQHLLSHNDILKKDLAEHLAANEKSNQTILQKAERISEANDNIEKELKGYKQVHNDMFHRLENQEAILEKIQRQVNEFRSLLYERSHYLVEKIEDSYRLTSSYIYKLVSGADKPVTWYVDQRKLSNNKQDD